jgi:hypothetical protein
VPRSPVVARIRVTPGFLAHHEQAYRGALRRVHASGMRQPEPEGFPHRRAERSHGGVGPGPDRQPGRAPGLLQDLEIAQLAGQEDVVPAADRADRHGYTGHPLPVVDPGPARGAGVVGQNVLDVVRMVPDGGGIGLAERERAQGPARPPGLRGLPQHRPGALLARDHHSPAERRLQRKGVRAEEVQRQRRLRHLRDHRLDLGRQAIGHRPLHVAQVAGAAQDDRPAEPGLLHQPLQGGQAVVALAPHGVEGPTGAERAPGALDQYLEAAFGQRPGHPHAEQPPPAVRGAEQRGRQPLAAGPRRPPVRQQDGTVGHRYREVPLDDQIPGRRRGQAQRPLDQMTADVH